MAQEPDSLVLVYLRRMDANIAALREDSREIKHRQNEMARQLASFRRDQGSDAGRG